jgi:hypothetical protein
MNMPTLQDMQGKSISKLFTDYVKEPSAMEIDDDVPREMYDIVIIIVDIKYSYFIKMFRF